MARRRIETADVRCMTVNARKVSIFIDRYEFLAQILSGTDFVMTLGTRRDRHIRLQPAQRGGFGNVDVTGHTLAYVLFLLTTAIVLELRGDSYRRVLGGVGSGELVTAVAVVGNWLLRLPVTVETRAMTCRHRLEHCRA